MSLPIDVILRLFQYLPFKDKFTLLKVNRTYYQAGITSLWAHLDFPSETFDRLLNTLQQDIGVQHLPLVKSLNLSKYSGQQDMSILLHRILSHDKLKTLVLSNSPIAESILLSLPENSLARLELSGCLVQTDTLNQALSQCHLLKTLIVDGCSGVHDSMFAVIPVKLQHLSMNNCADISDQGLLTLQCPRLISIQWSLPSSISLSNVITDTGLCRLIQQSPKLQQFSFPGLTRLSDTTIHALSQCTQLTALNIAHCPHVSPQALHTLLKTSSSLKHVNIDGCERILSQLSLQHSSWIPVSHLLHLYQS